MFCVIYVVKSFIYSLIYFFNYNRRVVSTGNIDEVK